MKGARYPFVRRVQETEKALEATYHLLDFLYMAVSVSGKDPHKVIHVRRNDYQVRLLSPKGISYTVSIDVGGEGDSLIWPTLYVLLEKIPGNSHVAVLTVSFDAKDRKWNFIAQTCFDEKRGPENLEGGLAMLPAHLFGLPFSEGPDFPDPRSDFLAEEVPEHDGTRVVFTLLTELLQWSIDG